MRRLSVVAVVVMAACAIYLSNGTFLGSYDSAPASLTVPTLLATGRLDFDRLRGSALVRSDAAYAFVEAPDGHLVSLFPIGTAIVTAPIYLAFAAAARLAGRPQPSPAAAAFEPIRRSEEKLAAAIVAALSVGLFLACALLLAAPAPAAVATAVYALCTPVWTIASQALWQHGPVNLVLLATIYALLRAGRAQTPSARAAWLAAAGLGAGLLPVIRPTALVFTLAALLFTAWAHRGRAGWFAFGCAAGIAPGLAWNLATFHDLAGGYAGNAASFRFAPARAAAAFAALLVSPSRGLFAFSPVLLFAFPGALRAWRGGTRDGRLLVALGCAGAALAVVYAFFDYWWAGFTYGPRFLSDTAAVMALLLLGAIPARAPGRVVFALAAIASLVVQFAGANGGAAGSEWNAVPVSIDLAPQRAWELRDGQIERNLRGAYFRFVPPPAIAGADAEVTSVVLGAPQTRDGERLVPARATVRNDGPATLPGYASGRYGGQLRVRVRVFARDGGGLLSRQLLYVANDVAPSATGTAVGVLRFPAGGLYPSILEPAIVGGTVRERAPLHAALDGGT